ncbi:aldo/keto reductase [Rickettsiales endosymbiont of Stachyamoeba lipophora]|uniref:aldo/keto reductase n=1 Tax=Rickettsiales endosymbiont of Stachyamoeba lipophora TaxID=2486578 RepID=UPI0013DE0C3F|nr:aldo/keto reductase [Rickettsiales endosymbiont of Stachyamoeba lipophora]
MPTLPPIALGTATIAGGMPNKSLAMNVNQQAEIIRQAIELYKKYNLELWIDTAPLYGNGNALIATGIALGEHPSSVTLSIKVGRILEQVTDNKPYVPGPFAGEGHYNIRFDYSIKGINNSFKQNFEFLNKARKERGWSELAPKDFKNLIIFIHDPETGMHGANTGVIIKQVKKEALPALNELKKQKQLTHIGVGTNEVDAALELVDSKFLDIIMVAGRFTLLANKAPKAPKEIKEDTAKTIELLNAAKQHAKYLVSASPGNSGLMYPGGNWYNYKTASAEILEFRDKIIKVFDKYHLPIDAGIFRFPIEAGAVATVMGALTSEQIEANLKSFKTKVPLELWQELQEEGLVNSALTFPPQ